MQRENLCIRRVTRLVQRFVRFIPQTRRGGGGGRGSGHGGGSRGRRCPAAIGRCASGGIAWGSSRGRTARRLRRRRCLHTICRTDRCAVRILAWYLRQNLRALYFRSGLYRLSPQQSRIRRAVHILLIYYNIESLLVVWRFRFHIGTH